MDRSFEGVPPRPLGSQGEIEAIAEDARGLGFGRAHWCTRRPVPEGNQDYEHQMRQRVGGTRSPRRCSGGERGVMRRHAKEAMLHHFHVASE